jgi:hypothetical protein
MKVTELFETMRHVYRDLTGWKKDIQAIADKFGYGEKIVFKKSKDKVDAFYAHHVHAGTYDLVKDFGDIQYHPNVSSSKKSYYFYGGNSN